jgi:hypothetical protein
MAVKYEDKKMIKTSRCMLLIRMWLESDRDGARYLILTSVQGYRWFVSERNAERAFLKFGIPLDGQLKPDLHRRIQLPNASKIVHSFLFNFSFSNNSDLQGGSTASWISGA